MILHRRKTNDPARGGVEKKLGEFWGVRAPGYLESLSEGAGIGSVAAAVSAEVSVGVSLAAAELSLTAAAVSVLAAACVSSSASACVPMPRASSVRSVNIYRFMVTSRMVYWDQSWNTLFRNGANEASS
jgi:hypothetical protein